MFVIYTDLIGGEVIVTTYDNEIETLNKYFTGDLGRELKTYTRHETDQPNLILSPSISWDLGVKNDNS